jgi:hypothetical protein
MNKMKLKNSWISKITLIVIAVILIWSMFNIKIYSHAEEDNKYLIDHDVQQYYSYLPAALIYKDLTFSFVDDQPHTIKRHFWRIPVKDQPGKYVVKMSLGLSYAYLPFFLIGHIYASNSAEYTANGFSKPYEFALAISSICFVLLGMWFLRLTLLRWFSEWISSIVLVLILFSTNLYYYTTTEPAMSHAYLFGLFAVFIHQSIRWVELQRWQQAIWLGIIGGTIVCIRPIHLLIFIFPLLYAVKNFSDLKARLRLIFSRYGQLILLTVGFFCMIFPQLLFWKYNTGSWIYYSYTEEGFFFSAPQIWNGLFSYRKGWLLYTPLFIFSLIGMYSVYKKHKDWLVFLCIYLPLHLYIVFSWWCWWYGGSFGSRAMIETYTFLAVPLAAFIQFIASRHTSLKIAFVGIALFLLTLNLVQTQQKRLGLIHWDGMTKTAYWRNFMKLEDVGGIWGDFREPNYAAAIKGQREYNTIGSEINFLKNAGYFDLLLEKTKDKETE